MRQPGAILRVANARIEVEIHSGRNVFVVEIGDYRNLWCESYPSLPLALARVATVLHHAENATSANTTPTGFVDAAKRWLSKM